MSPGATHVGFGPRRSQPPAYAYVRRASRSAHQLLDGEHSEQRTRRSIALRGRGTNTRRRGTQRTQTRLAANTSVNVLLCRSHPSPCAYQCLSRNHVLPPPPQTTTNVDTGKNPHESISRHKRAQSTKTRSRPEQKQAAPSSELVEQTFKHLALRSRIVAFLLHALVLALQLRNRVFHLGRDGFQRCFRRYGFGGIP